MHAVPIITVIILYYDAHADIFLAAYNIMKTILTIAVISCFIAMGLAQNCASREADLNSTCHSRVATGVGDFCDTCANALIRYYRDCDAGVGVEEIQQCT